MDELEKFSAEKKFFGENDIMSLPQLVEIYFEEENFPLVCYLSDLHEKEFSSLGFYKMLALAELGKLDAAKKVYDERGDDWLNICKQYKVYWKHIILFALYFRQKNYPDWFQELLNLHYDSELVQLFEMAREISLESFVNMPLFKKICERHPPLKKIYAKREVADDLITFEKVQWKIWDKYNFNLRDSPFDENKIQCVYDNGVTIYSYKPHQVAASMHILTDGEVTIIFDCGAELVEDGVKNIPVKKILSALEISSVDAVFISHGHLDHYGSLNELPQVPIYMTIDTANIIQMSSPNIFLRGVKVKNFYEEVDVGGVKIRLIPNGHIRGSVLFDVNWCGGKRIIYTGDYCLENQHTCAGLDLNSVLTIPKRTDVLLTESTYGRKNLMLSLHEYETVFKNICELIIKFGKKIIIPSFAVGRAAEIAMLLKDSARKNNFTILIDGLAAQMTEYYQNSMEQTIIGSNISVSTSNLELRERIDNYDVIIASSGMLQEGSTSYAYMQEMLNMEKVCVLKVGFIHEYESMLLSVFNRRHQNVTFFDIPLSAHADYKSLVAVTEKISPETAIYVHGHSIAPPNNFLG